jgi:hypothetical protein
VIKTIRIIRPTSPGMRRPGITRSPLFRPGDIDDSAAAGDIHPDIILLDHHVELDSNAQYTAFEGFRQIAQGLLQDVALAVKATIAHGSMESVLAFDDQTGKRVDIDVLGTDDEVLDRLGGRLRTATSAVTDRGTEATPTSDGSRGRGRPKLGVVAREVTLLPRHWEWLNSQPGGASVALRKLVDEARRANESVDRVRRSREATYAVMSAVAGDLPGFEEATRALFAGDSERFRTFMAEWPQDVSRYAARLSAASFGSTSGCEADAGPQTSGA